MQGHVENRPSQESQGFIHLEWFYHERMSSPDTNQQ